MKQNIIFNYMLDLCKEEVDVKERAIVIRNFLDENKMSIRGLAEKLNKPKSTIEDWLLWNRISEQKIGELKSNGYSHTEIYRSLRNNKAKESLPIERETKFDAYLKECTQFFRVNEKKVDFDPNTVFLIKKLRDQLNRVMMHMERRK